MDLRESLTQLRDAAAAFRGGTQIRNREEALAAAESSAVVNGLVARAKQRGATPYEITSAVQGEVIGSSFLDQRSVSAVAGPAA